MTCKQCGAEYEGSVCPNGCNNQKKKKPIFKRWWFWLIVGIIVISAVSSGDKEPAPSGTSGSSSQVSTTPIETTAAPDPYFHVGDTIDANGLKITYVKAEEHKESNQFLQPDDGYKYIKLFLSVDNTSNSDRYISSFEFDCYADGKKQETYYSSEKALEGGNLSAGRKDEGYIYFSVPVDATDIEVEYETNFWSDKKAVLKVELD